ncbi:bifunctional diaminohydroxyphosphoribosylaminopyrimidine deaminase/5-amino-6-(5-phosphoribosylamino)uracil reductase RibD, partial [Campylobacter lari]|nr:bifunctional diaminohydroxyphosphoribosylaminopyrimidine deaminase/5-amino-6-(5-phosphoribosylamino)uracil reductase RibD [Campylobacter lari]
MRGHVWPNPPVGCVIVKNGICIGEGATQPGGRPHAERVALDIAGEAARGATLYVTLEPCCHWGHTSPCADAIIMAGITRVVASQQDPDPRVNGGGFRQLAEAGIDVAIGEGAKEAA